MPEAVDVGSVLGGRYRVTAYVLASAEKDLVLDGVDQVLDRPVSILVASAGNAAQVATSARDLATGDRNSSIQVLDLGITEAGTYLVTNRASAADLLDLIVQQEPAREDEPYVEPFFTDTLGSEIFGGPRSTEPEARDDDDRHRSESRLSRLRGRFNRHEPNGSQEEDTSDLPAVVGEAPERRQSNHVVPPPPSQKPGGSFVARGESPRNQDDEERWADDAGDDGDARAAGAGAASGAGAAGVVAGASAASASPSSGRPASRFPLADDRDDGAGEPNGPDDDLDDDTDDGSGRTFSRVLVGVVLTVVLVVAVVVAATQLGSLFDSSPVAGPGTDRTAGPATDGTSSPTPDRTPTAEARPDPVTPVIAGITRVVPDNPGLDAANDANLPLVVDGDPATVWGNQVYASDKFGGLATNLALVVQLEKDSTISQVAIDQLNGTGGSFSVLLNNQPSLQGAQQIAQGGFTAPTVSLPIPPSTDGPRTGRYVIVNFTQLPRLSNIQAQYPFGLRIAEIRVS